MVSSTKRWRYVVADRDRYGKIRLYLRRKGQPKIPLPGLLGSEEFEAAYRLAMGGVRPDTRTVVTRSKGGTLRRLCEEYFASAEFKQLDETTRSKRRPILEGICQEPLSPDDADPMGDCPISEFSSAHVRVLRDRKIATPEAANARVKALRRLFHYAVDQKPVLAPGNPARDVPLLRGKTGGHHPWTLAEIETFAARHPMGTPAHKALSVIFFTGVRISDAARIGRQHETKSGRLIFTSFKNRNRRPVKIDIPILPILRAALDACPSRGMTYLETQAGNPYGIKSLGQWFRDRCDEAGLKHCSAHGLRKAGATIAAENGATDAQLMAIFGWSDHRQPAHYTRSAQRARLATSGMSYLIPLAAEDED